MSEATLVHAVLKLYGARHGLRVARINTGAAMLHGRFVRFNPPGTADIVGILAPLGRIVMIECKSATGKQRKAQEAMQRTVTSLGGIYILARTIDDVATVLEPLLQIPDSRLPRAK